MPVAHCLIKPRAALWSKIIYSPLPTIATDEKGHIDHRTASQYCPELGHLVPDNVRQTDRYTSWSILLQAAYMLAVPDRQTYRQTNRHTDR